MKGRSFLCKNKGFSEHPVHCHTDGNHEGEGLEKFLHSLFINHWCKAVISTLQQTQFYSIDLRLNCELNRSLPCSSSQAGAIKPQIEGHSSGR